METVDTVVVGAGVVGLAIARQLAQAGHEVLILEACERFGTQTSARNSEVIHAGLYYPPGSLKARLCVRGKALLYAYCAEHGTAHQRIGKLLVACDQTELPLLASYAARSAANGVPLQPLNAVQIGQLEPAIQAIAGLYSESTGIIDSHGLMLSLLGDAERAGALLATHAPVASGMVGADGFFILKIGDAQSYRLRCRQLVNAAGLGAQTVARSLAGFPIEKVAPTFYAKGHYFLLNGSNPFRYLVYPMPDQAGLGIHVTVDLGGQCKFGPDVSSWLTGIDYRFEAGLEQKFYQAIRRYYPDLADGALRPGYTGIRPKVTGPRQAAGDFILQGPSFHGVAGLVNLFGIESPGLTAALAIAELVATLLE